jgi:hypothetical protein
MPLFARLDCINIKRIFVTRYTRPDCFHEFVEAIYTHLTRRGYAAANKVRQTIFRALIPGPAVTHGSLKQPSLTFREAFLYAEERQSAQLR